MGGAALLTACSWITTFVVVNDTDAPIQVVYRLKEGGKLPPCPDDYFVGKPRIRPRESVDELAFRGADIPIAEYTCDSASRTVTLQLPPRQAVALFSVTGYTGHRTEQELQQYNYVSYALESLRIRGRSGEMQYVGNQVTRDFAKNNVALYILTFR